MTTDDKVQIRNVIIQLIKDGKIDELQGYAILVAVKELAEHASEEAIERVGADTIEAMRQML